MYTFDTRRSSFSSRSTTPVFDTRGIGQWSIVIIALFKKGAAGNLQLKNITMWHRLGLFCGILSRQMGSTSSLVPPMERFAFEMQRRERQQQALSH